MLRFFKIAFLVSVAVYIATLIYYNIPRRLCVVPDGTVRLIQTGDIIMSEGFSLKSDAVRLLSGVGAVHQFSHCGIARVEGDSTYVVHMSTDSSRIVSEEIHRFVVQNTSLGIGVYRLREPFPLPSLCRQLDSLQAIPMPFDPMFHMQSEKSYYCTELVVKVFSHIGCPAFQSLLHEDRVTPSELILTGKLKEVAYVGNDD